VGLAFAVPAAPALAQTQGGSGTPTSPSTSAGPGQPFSMDICNPAFTSGTTITLTNAFDGKSTSGPGGDASCTGTSGAGKHVSGVAGPSIVNNTVPNSTLGDPVTVTYQCGTNTITASGNGATGSGTLNVSCPAATPVTNPPSSTVAFTGANILRWTLAAAVLLGLGALMVWGSRRRRSPLDD
jgi:hypothetical protein